MGYIMIYHDITITDHDPNPKTQPGPQISPSQVIRVNSPVTSFYDKSSPSRSRCIDGTCYDVVLVATDAPAAGYLLGGEWQWLGSKCWKNIYTRLKKHHKMITWLKIFWWLFMATLSYFTWKSRCEAKSSGFGRCVWKQKTGGLVWCFKPLFLGTRRELMRMYIYIYVLRSFNFGRDRCWRW